MKDLKTVVYLLTVCCYNFVFKFYFIQTDECTGETVASCIQGQVVTQGRPWLVVYRDKLLHRGDRG